DLLLHLALEIDQEVAAGDQVQPRKRRISDQVVQREQAHVPDLARHLVEIALLDEEALQALGRNLAGDRLRVPRLAGRFQRLRVDVRGEDLDVGRLLEAGHVLAQQDGERVRLLTGGAAGYPDAHVAVRVLALEEPWHDLGGKEVERPRIAEEVGHADQQVPEEPFGFLGIAVQELDVIIYRATALLVEPPADAAHQRALLVTAEVVPGLPPQDGADLPQVGGDLLAEALRAAALVLPQAGQVSDELRRHLVDRQHVIDGAGEDGAARHAVVGRRLGSLHDRQAAPLLDRLEAQRAVRTAAREDDADGLVLLVLGQGAEEAVDRRAPAAEPRRLGGIEHAVVDGQRDARRHDID